jgi:hypothetical protein
MAIRAQYKHIFFWGGNGKSPELDVFEHPISDNVFPSPKSKSSDYNRRKTGLFIGIPEAKLLFNGMKYAEREKRPILGVPVLGTGSGSGWRCSKDVMMGGYE